MNLNFFGDKHGKSEVDIQFSNVSRFIKAESLTRKIYNSQGIVDAIIKRQCISNENKQGILGLL